MKKVLLCSVIFLVGCKGMIHINSIKPSLTIVADRHDRYVRADPGLTSVERETQLRTTELLRQILEEASK